MLCVYFLSLRILSFMGFFSETLLTLYPTVVSRFFKYLQMQICRLEKLVYFCKGFARMTFISINYDK